MKTLKRTNWTTEEVIDLLNGMKLASEKECQFVEGFNAGVGACVSMFVDFDRPVEEFGATAYCVETKEIYHVGGIPPR